MGAQITWYSKSKKAVLEELQVDSLQGLSTEEATSRLKKYGANKLTAKKRTSIFKLIVLQLNDWLIYILFAAVSITVVMGQYVDAVIIISVIIVNAVLGVVQEIKAGNAVLALNKLTLPKTVVRRNGTTLEIVSDTVVPGDIVILEAGGFISADLRLIESSNLQIEESALTGESLPAEKDANVLIKDSATPLGDLVNMAFTSTSVQNGRGVGVVVETAMNTEVGKIAKIINTEKKSKTPLQIRLDTLGKKLGLIAVGICILIFGIAMLQGKDLAEMFLTSVSLAVAVIPEGLSAIVAVVLSLGVTKLSKQNAIIKKLQPWKHSVL
jgi:P-type Ca2+ transporter type 2C